MDDYYAQCSKKEKYIAIGECGLDYDRFEYADKETQLR
jgi:Tat protein secretion system quality control protein TatD with DNase activity